jgi:hypothetical protein
MDTVVIPRIFLILDDDYLECLRCGHQFFIDFCDEENLFFSWAKMEFVPICPVCWREED